MGGKVQECLAGKRALLSWDCQEQLFRQKVENADDLRLSARLFRACLTDKKKVCAFQWFHLYGVGLRKGCMTWLRPMHQCSAETTDIHCVYFSVKAYPHHSHMR